MDCQEFLAWALPQLGLRPRGFARVRRQVCKRLGQRVRELKLGGFEAYRSYLLAHAEEWPILESYSHITISRFLRDRAVFDQLAENLLPHLANECLKRADSVLRCWSAGCGAGEEPYTLCIQWQQELRQQFPNVSLGIFATDADAHQLARARSGIYRGSSLKELPATWQEAAFTREAQDAYRIRDELRTRVTFSKQDLRRDLPEGPFSLLLCRNLAFTYWNEAEQNRIASALRDRLLPGGVLVVGKGERPPNLGTAFLEVGNCLFSAN